MYFRFSLLPIAVLIVLIPACSPEVRKNEPPQKKDSGALVITLGEDTIVIQQFEISGDTIRSKVVSLPQGIYVTDAEGLLYPDGSIRELHSRNYKVARTRELIPDRQMRISTTRDSTFLTGIKGADSGTKAYAGHAMVINDGDISSFFLFPFWVYFAPTEEGDSIRSHQFVMDSNRDFILQRTGKQELTVSSSILGKIHLQTDASGRLHQINGIGSSLNIKATVIRALDFDSMLQARISAEQRYGPMPGQSPRDLLHFEKAGFTLDIDYSRPSVRGRKIFGGIVPYGRFWRTGANWVTEWSSNKDVLINGKRLKAGRYSLFTLPKPGKEWTLMFNSQTGIWGTDYDPAADQLRVPLRVEAIPDLVEQLTIAVLPTAQGANLTLEWENTRATLSFSIPK